MQEWMWEKENVIRLTIVTGNQTFPYNTTTVPQPELTTQLPFLDTLGYNAVQVSARSLYSTHTTQLPFLDTLGYNAVQVSAWSLYSTHTTQLPFLDTLGYNAVQVSAPSLNSILQRKSDLCTPRKETARRQIPMSTFMDL
jgi:hypothetical protein